MKGQDVLNLMKKTDKNSDSSIELTIHTQILKQTKTIKWHESQHTYQY
jgi:hypothetical protein